ncbi:MAG TPA: 1,6-anhydro-N-acetylmuramyl-L-alanine amidase AmpD [Gammaproteobacteria bacterium]|nr:1,6-anhydro-N-acetylmuramyl-L-alanine amidase AmpD [Gammaproteobacteria bacterium]
MLKNVQDVPSPNCNERPENAVINMIVIHGISIPEGEYGNDNVIKLFQNRLKSMQELKVSSHLYIRRDGEVIQFVPFDLRAWHAGVSNFQGEENCNDFSIGIELEGSNHEVYTDSQYEKLKEIIKYLKKRYPAITNERIIGHSDIAPGRKTDPGPFFEWDRIRS